MPRGTAHAQGPSVWRSQCAGWDGGEGGSELSQLEDPGRCLVPHASHKPAVLYRRLVQLVIGIILECVLLMLKFEPEEEQLSWLCSTRRNREPLKCIWVSKAGCTQRQHISAVRRGTLVAIIFLTEAALLLPLHEVQCRKDDCLEGAAGRQSCVQFPQGSSSSFCEPLLCVCLC